ncbi:FecR family protein [Pseudomonas flavescens]|uniref:FecR family protein n=1 Tax=Phytopseudomonas flavescens TaxID=29435 RepID=A0A1G8PLX3_9GAMM|nr:FecR family protein [Pseudomonas flavescens]SDI92840.1 FecR family protein [Pseudomonas flavescens]
MNARRPDELIIDEAAQWLALLQSGQANAAELQAFAQWRDSDIRHAEVFAAMGGGLGTLDVQALQRMPRDRLLHTLNAPSGRRRFLGTGLVVMLGLGLGYRILGEDDVITTTTAQRLQLTLEDGSKLTINARSWVRTQFDASQRLLHLQQGELLVDVAKDAQRPFVVQSERGRMRALGTRFLVREEKAATHIVMFHSQVEIVTNGGTRQLIKAGEFARFDAERILELGTASGSEGAWTGGHLEVRDQPLGEVIDSMRPYRRGIVQVSPQVAQLRLSGIYPLDDSDLSLQLLEESLPIHISYRTPYWVVIEER